MPSTNARDLADANIGRSKQEHLEHIGIRKYTDDRGHIRTTVYKSKPGDDQTPDNSDAQEVDTGNKADNSDIPWGDGVAGPSEKDAANPAKKRVAGELIHSGLQRSTFVCVLSLVIPPTGHDVVDRELKSDVDLTQRIQPGKYYRLEHAFRLTPPSLLLTPDELASYKAIEKNSDGPIPFSPDDAVIKQIAQLQVDGEAKDATDLDIVRFWWTLTKLHPDVFDTPVITPDLIGHARLLMLVQGFTVDIQHMHRLLSPQLITISCGEIPCDFGELSLQDGIKKYEAAIANLKALDHKKLNERSNKYDSDMAKAEEEAKKLRFFKPSNHFADPFDEVVNTKYDAKGRVIIEQIDDVQVRFRSMMNPKWKSEFVIEIRQNYIDASQPHMQPSVTYEIRLDQDNCRKGYFKDKSGYKEFDTKVVKWQVVDDIDLLKTLWPHVSHQRWQEILESLTGDRLIWLNVPLNMLVKATGLFPPFSDDLPPLLNAIRVAARNHPSINVLVRTNPDAFILPILQVREQWKNLAFYDPVLAMFKNPKATYLSSKHVEDLGHWPAINIPATYTFDNERHWARWIGLTSMAEMLYENKKKSGYQGDAAFIPVPASAKPKIRPGHPYSLTMAYIGSVRLDEESLEKPRLMPDDKIDLALGHSLVAEEDPRWSGYIVDSDTFGLSDSLTFVIFRQYSKKNGFSIEDLAGIDPKEVEEIKDPEKIRMYLRKASRHSVTLYGTNTVEVARREQKLLDSANMSDRQAHRDEIQAHTHKLLLRFLVGSQFDTLPIRRLFDHLPEDFRDEAHDQLLSICQDNQLEKVVNPMIERGGPLGFEIIAGPPGSGKTWVCINMTVPYLKYGIRIPLSMRLRENMAKERYAIDNKIDEGFRFTENEFQEADQKPDEMETCDAKVLFVAAQNPTVNDLCIKAIKAYEHINPPPLCIRFLPEAVNERHAVSEILHRMDKSFDSITPEWLTDPISPDDLTMRPILNHMNRLDGDIKDKRVNSEILPHTLGHAIAQVVGKIPRTPAINAVFTEEELEHWEKVPELWNAVIVFNNSGKDQFTPDLLKAAHRSLRDLAAEILRRADCIVTTYSLATMDLLRGCFFPHLLHLEEVNRVPESATASVMLAYPNVLYRFANCDFDQLNPASFGDRNNITTTQREMAWSERLRVNNYPIKYLNVTRRFCSDELFQAAEIVNPSRDLVRHPDSFNGDIVKRIAMNNLNLYDVHSTIIWYDAENMVTKSDVNRSSYCIKSAIITINLAKREVLQKSKTIPHLKLVVQTPYNAQLSLLKTMWNASILRSTSVERTIMSSVKFQTTDNTMGEETDGFILDTCNVRGHILDPRRTCVALTRARYFFIVVGNGKTFTDFRSSDRIRLDTPFRKFAMYCHKKGFRYVLSDKEYQRSMYKFDEVVKDLGLGGY